MDRFPLMFDNGTTPSSHLSRPQRPLAFLLALSAGLAPLAACGTAHDTAGDGSSKAPSVELPPANGGFDYQIGGAYRPAAGVSIVSRDRSDSPAPGLYNICYVNAFQAQPGKEGSWPEDLLLRDADGDVVIDEDWDEALLDIGTAGKRKRVAAEIGRWVDGCARKGFDAVELDNYDSYTRSDDALTANDAKAFIALLAAQAHRRGLAVGQKNTAELAGDRSRTGLDFAVAEECGQYDECDTYIDAFRGRVVDIEYTDSGLRKACEVGDEGLHIVRRDVEVATPDDDGYVRRTC